MHESSAFSQHELDRCLFPGAEHLTARATVILKDVILMCYLVIIV